MQLFDAFEKYRARCLIGKSKGTEKKHRRAIRVLGETLGSLPTVDDLTDDNLASVVQRIIDKGSGPHTANDYRSKLVAQWNFARRRGWINTGADFAPLDVEEAVPIAWTREELVSVIAACELSKNTFCSVPGPLFFRTLVHVLWDTAERIGAILQCRADDLSGDQLFVRASTRKGRTRSKRYSLSPDTVALLMEMRSHHKGERLFDLDCTDQTMTNRWRSCLKRAGLPHDRQHLWHCFRRSVASHAAAAGADASALLDHSSKAITDRHYIDKRIVPEQRAIDFLFRPGASM